MSLSNPFSLSLFVVNNVHTHAEPWVVRAKDLTFSPASHENPADPGCLKKVLARRDDLPAGRIQMLNWTVLPAGKGFQKHYHEDMFEIFVVASGQIQAITDTRTQQLLPGDAWFVPPRAAHRMLNTLDTDAFYVVFGVSSEQGGKTIVVK